MQSTLLALETSCDETSAAIISGGKILANIVATQEIHSQYGGVIPELASRNHDLFIASVTQEALNKANKELKDLDAVAVTQGPGLLGALLVGNTFAKGLSWGLSIPLIGVNHLQAHISALFIDYPNPSFPIIVLLVSGGHTQLIKINCHTDYELLGQTIDDAAGEAYDKTAKLLGLPYPGGQHIDRLAKTGNPNAFSFPEPKVPGLNFSFSGLKTSILYFVNEQSLHSHDFVNRNLNDLCASIQNTINNYLTNKLIKAVKQHNPKGIAIVGGVSANSDLRKRMVDLGNQISVNVLIPKFEYCTDNAAMIAMAAHYAYEKRQFIGLESIPFTRDMI
ncbi:MAG: tRNA (adenosine(37)-N6)-threonylcarbamoyltransferase complex transferase subunit TsaD [Bacteroidetes bacterium]|nr:tRNA (adenosine(37)-N6)-threonylcarbamoyltransferase complex transferase subunit TsaD [Bacteroidota bacterium]